MSYSNSLKHSTRKPIEQSASLLQEEASLRGHCRGLSFLPLLLLHQPQHEVRTMSHLHIGKVDGPRSPSVDKNVMARLTTLNLHSVMNHTVGWKLSPFACVCQHEKPVKGLVDCCPLNTSCPVQVLIACRMTFSIVHLGRSHVSFCIRALRS